MRAQAAEILREGLKGVEGWVRARADAAVKAAEAAEAADGGSAAATAAAKAAAAAAAAASGAGADADVDAPDWELLGQRAKVVGGEAATSLQSALQAIYSAHGSAN